MGKEYDIFNVSEERGTKETVATIKKIVSARGFNIPDNTPMVVFGESRHACVAFASLDLAFGFGKTGPLPIIDALTDADTYFSDKKKLE